MDEEEKNDDDVQVCGIHGPIYLYNEKTSFRIEWNKNEGVD